jgi:chaperonin GroEL
MWKVITIGKESRQKIFEGIKEIANTVAQTYGPFWKNVILDNIYTEPEITNDGITVVRGIDFEDRYKNMGAFLLKKACARTNKLAGDWTSATTIIASAIIEEWLKYIENDVSPFKLAESMNKLTKEVIQQIEYSVSKVSGKEDLIRIATISSQDEEVGNLIADAFERVWNGGTVTVEESQKLWLSIEMKVGFEFEEQLKSPLLVTDVKRQQCELENAYVFVSDKKLVNLQVISTVIDQIIKEWRKDIFFIVDDIDPMALSALIYNHQKGLLNIWLVKAPWYGENKEAFYQDICAVTWALLISDKNWLDWKNVDISHLWVAERIISWRMSTIVVWGNRNEESIMKTLDFISEDLKRTTDERKQLQLEKRRAKLTGGIATIKVGYPTDVETSNKRMKIEDAVMATKSAIQEWIVVGEWVTLIEAIRNIVPDGTARETLIAYNILSKALEIPTKTIINNAWGEWEYAVWVLKERNIFGTWYDPVSRQFIDLKEKWIFDPFKVVRVSLENAVSLANMILTSNAVVTEDPKNKIDDQDVKIQ